MLSKNEIDSKSGFFKQSYTKFRESLTDDDLQIFTNLTTDEDRFLFVLEKHDSNTYSFKKDDNKDKSKAVEFKEQGNKSFQNELYNQSLYFYTRSLQYFPSTKEYEKDLAITRANRSAALYHMNKYHESIKDIDIAIKGGYPEELLYKVKDRKARCLLALKQHKAALKAFQETIQALDNCKLKTENKQKWQRDVQIMISMMTKIPMKDDKIAKDSSNEKLIYEKNPIFKSASNAVTIKKNEIEGRFAVASKDIDIGEIILMEQPHCAVLLPEFAPTNCFNCFRRVNVGEPCPGCSDVIFCSVKCRSEANLHHNTECNIIKTLWSSGLSITCIMALRIITQKQPQYFTSQTFQEADQLWKTGCYKSTDYNTVYNLVRHESNRKTEDMLHRASVAVFLYFCLQAGNYFNEKDDSKVVRLIGGLLLRHLQILQFNAHEVSELRVQGKSFAVGTSTFIGGAVYPTLALFNHSCNPSITRYFDGTTVVTRAIKKIRKGEKISENYGPMFTQTEREERLMTLKNQYWFDCNCEACSGNWPIMDKMDVTVLPFKCKTAGCDNVISVPLTTTNCIIMCRNCGANNNIMKGLKVLQDTENIFRLGMAYLEEGDAEGALKKFSELYKLVDDVLVPPFKDYHLCQQAIRTCFLTRGNICKMNVNK